MFIGRESKVRLAYDSGPDHDALIKAYNLYFRDGGSYDKDGNKITIRYCAQKFGVSISALVRRINGNVNLLIVIWRDVQTTKMSKYDAIHVYCVLWRTQCFQCFYMSCKLLYFTT